MKIVSGGQTGADRTALDVAIELGAPHGGWCPRGRLAEDGAIPDRYDLRETPTADFAQRTEWNVRDSDATVIFSTIEQPGGGSRLTQEVAERMGRPLLRLCGDMPPAESAKRLITFIVQHEVRTLNVAGPRASQDPAVGELVLRVLRPALIAIAAR